MADPLAEAIAALRVLGDPAKAWGHGKERADNIQIFARAARERVIQLRDAAGASGEIGPAGPPAVAMCATCGEEPAGPSGRCPRCDRSIQEDQDNAQLSVIYTKQEHAANALAKWSARGIEASVLEVKTKGGGKGFAVVAAHG